MKSAKLFLAALMIPASTGLMSLSGCGSEASPSEQQQLVVDSNATIKDMEITDPQLSTDLKSAVGYAVFPNVGAGAVGIKVASGNGEVYVQGGGYIGAAHLTLGGLGLSVGGESYSELILFQTKEALQSFENNQLNFDATATATALQAGADATVKYNKGVAVLKHVKGGLMVDASIGGQQFTFKAANAQPVTQPTP